MFSALKILTVFVPNKVEVYTNFNSVVFVYLKLTRFGYCLEWDPLILNALKQCVHSWLSFFHVFVLW